MGKQNVKDLENASTDDDSEDAKGDEEFLDDLEIERHPSSRDITGVRVSNTFVGNRNFYVGRYSTLMLEADGGKDKFLGFVHDLWEEDDDVTVEICWFYRASDMLSPSEVPNDLLVCKARLTEQPRGGDAGRYREIFFSNHMDNVSIRTIMHPIKVWVLPSMELDSVTVNVPPLEGEKPPASADIAPKLLPGFICRRMYDTQTKELYPLSQVPSRRKQLESWVVTDVMEMLRRSERERSELKVELLNKVRKKAGRAQQGGSAGRPASAAPQ
ncbi:hypothetical protein Vafri_2215 [Volvox africanus]|nr:hypothetical protein Vafri_2215 [Volvox africanus]